MLIARTIITMALLALAGLLFWLSTETGMTPLQSIAGAIVGGVLTYWLTPPRENK